VPMSWRVPVVVAPPAISIPWLPVPVPLPLPLSVIGSSIFVAASPTVISPMNVAITPVVVWPLIVPPHVVVRPLMMAPHVMIWSLVMPPHLVVCPLVVTAHVVMGPVPLPVLPLGTLMVRHIMMWPPPGCLVLLLPRALRVLLIAEPLGTPRLPYWGPCSSS